MQHLAPSSTFPLGSNKIPGRRQGECSLKVVAFNGSARKDGNTAILVRWVSSCWEFRVYAVMDRLKAELQTLIDRCGHVAQANNDMLKRKVGTAVVAVRRAGAMHAFDSINHFFLIGQMIVPGSSYWNIGIGRAKGEVEQDE